MKGSLPTGFRYKDISDLIVAVCRVVSSRLAAGKYKGLVSELAGTPPCLVEHLAKSSSRKDTQTAQGEPGEVQQRKRLDATRISQHYDVHNAEGTFLVKSCRKRISTGDDAVRVYIIPKYTLHRATDNNEEMEKMLQLSLATTFEDTI